MSFALEYRKKMQADARAAREGKAEQEEVNCGFAVMPAGEDVDTGGNRRRVLATISLAAIILSFFNSGAMVQYAGGLTDSNIGMRIILATEHWHGLMEKNRLTLVVEEIRGVVSEARHSEWPDLASSLGFARGYTDREQPETIQPVEHPVDEKAPDEREPAIEITRPDGPVMRAAVE